MIKIVKADERHFTDAAWLKSYWLFSFSDYYDPDNVSWGALRVFNDDTVEPGEGFPPHPHQEMEIITLVLQGEITHEDNMGNKMTVKAGDVQRMSAGRGVVHSEMNLGQGPLHLYQIWIMPDKQGLDPAYEQKSFDPAGWKNRLAAVASGQGHPGAVGMLCDAAIYRAYLEGEVAHEVGPDRHQLLYVTAGQAYLNDNSLTAGDQARVTGEALLRILPRPTCELVLIDAG